MKKVLAVAMIAVLTASTVFAGFSGEAKLGYSYNLDNGNTGFSNSKNAVIDLELSTQSAEAEVPEGGVYATIKGSLTVKAYNGEKGGVDPKLVTATDVKASIVGEDWEVALLGVDGNLDLAKSAIDSSTVSNEDDDFGFDKNDYSVARSFSVPYKKAPGFAVTYKGYTVGLGLNYVAANGDPDENGTISVGNKNVTGYILQAPFEPGKSDDSVVIPSVIYVSKEKFDKEAEKDDGGMYKDYTILKTFYEEKDTENKWTYSGYKALEAYKGLDLTAVVKTPEIAIIDGLTVQAGASYYQNETAGVSEAKKPAEGADVFDKYVTNQGKAVGGSVAVAYTSDLITAKAAADMAYTFEAYKVDAKAGLESGDSIVRDSKKEGFDMDATGSISLYGLTVDGYAAFKDRYLSSKVAYDFNQFGIPVVVSTTAQGIAKESGTYGGAIETTPIEGLKIKANGSYTIDADYNADDASKATAGRQGQWKVGASAEYAFQDYVTVSAGFDLKNGAVMFVPADQTDYKAIYADGKTAEDVVVGLNISAKTTTLIPNAELSLGYSASDLGKVYSADYAEAKEIAQLGSITAACKVTF